MLKLQIWIFEGGGFVGKMGAAPRGAALPAFPLLGRGWAWPIPALQVLGHEGDCGLLCFPASPADP